MEATTLTFDVETIRREFPILSREVYDQPLVYLDNAATSQKPRVVLDRLARYYAEENANVHRGVHWLSAEGTEAYEAAREAVQVFIGAKSTREIVFTRGTTEAINVVAQSYGGQNVKKGDEVLVSALEHHANLVPWQMLCERQEARLRIIPCDDDGNLILDDLTGGNDPLINERTRIVAVPHTSNAIGTVVDLPPIVSAAHKRDIPVLIDGAQATPHGPVDVQALGADFFAFSGHKTFGPTGIGVLYGREALLETMPPVQGGGEMIDTVTYEKSTFDNLPGRLEAGTPHIAGAIGLHTALDWLSDLNHEAVRAHEHELITYVQDSLLDLGGMRLIGQPTNRLGAVSFVLEGIHPYDTGTVLDRLGIAVRTGDHCAQPLVRRLGAPGGTVRASFALYNTRNDVDTLVEGLKRVKAIYA